MSTRLHVVAVLLAVTAVIAGCGPNGQINACTLEPIDGTLIAMPDGRIGVDGAHWLSTDWIKPVALAWPPGWTTAHGQGDVLEVRDNKGTLKATTGEPFRFWAATRNGPPEMVDGAMQVCPF
jgi:hypothetical protein